MRIYLAAPYAVRDYLRPYAKELEAMGHISTASWLWAEHEITPGKLETAPDMSDDYAQDHALTDVEEVLASDAVVLVTWPTALELAQRATDDYLADLGGNSGGRHVETGVAFGSNIPVVVWGNAENIFHRGLATVCPTWEDVVNSLDGIQAARFGQTQPSTI